MLARSEEFQSSIDKWIEEESQGNEFPVPFDAAWQIAGYSRKDSVKRRLAGAKSRFVVNIDFTSTDRWNDMGTQFEAIFMTTECFKSFCLMAETGQGDLARKYFISAEKKWKLVQQTAPHFAARIENYYQYPIGDRNAFLNGLVGVEREQALLESRPYDFEKEALD